MKVVKEGVYSNLGFSVVFVKILPSGFSSSMPLQLIFQTGPSGWSFKRKCPV